MDCSTYCSVLPLNIERVGSACEKQAERPILRRLAVVCMDISVTNQVGLHGPHTYKPYGNSGAGGLQMTGKRRIFNADYGVVLVGNFQNNGKS